MRLDRPSHRRPSRAWGALLLPLAAVPLACSSDDDSSQTTISAPPTTEAPAEQVEEDDTDEALDCSPQNLSAAATDYPGWGLSHEVCASGNAVASLTSPDGAQTLVAFFGVGSSSWALIEAGEPQDYSADALPEGISRVMFARWQGLVAPPPPVGPPGDTSQQNPDGLPELTPEFGE